MKNPHETAEKQGETSVVVSLQELLGLQKERLAEEETRRAEEQAELQRREARERAEAEARAVEAAARAEAQTQKHRMAEAQIEGAKLAEIERARLETGHRLEMERIAAERAHLEAMAALRAKEKRGVRPSIAVAILVAAAAAMVSVVVWISVVAPKNAAREEVARARVLVDSDDPHDWDEAQKALAVAASKDPSNVEVAPLEQALKDKRAATKAKNDEAERAALDALKAESSASITAAPSAPIAGPAPKPHPPVQPKIAPKKDEGCTLNIAGVPMCSGPSAK